MFAVPGWSVSTSDLKPQQQQAPTAADAEEGASNNKNKNGTDNSQQQSSKKRKRDQNSKNGVVTKSNLDEMFRRHIEGYAVRSGDSGSKEKKKKQNKNKNKNKKEADGVKDENKNSLQQQQQQEEEKSLVNVDESRPAKKQKKNKDSKKKHENEDTADASSAVATSAAPPPPPPAPAAGAKLTPLQQKMRDKLMSARFRHLNETLYTTPSKQAFEMFTANPELFAEYHAGFSRQVKESWPSNPVDGYIAAIKARGAVSPNVGHKKHSNNNKLENKQTAALPRRPNGICTIADLGCGDAQLARALTPSAKKLQLKLLSYDLHAPDPLLITKADIANLPLEDGTVDVAVFCLSLMGTNWVSFVEEAYRVLRSDGKGECWVSEVKSRFGRVTRKKAQIGLKKSESDMQKKKKNNKKKKGGKGGKEFDEDFDDEEEEIFAEDAQHNQSSGSHDETDISAFVEVFKSRGFILKQESVDKSNKMFIKMEFVKAGGAAPTKGKYAGMMPSGKPVSTQTKKKFIDKDVDVKELTAEEEAKVLKPCVYKIR